MFRPETTHVLELIRQLRTPPKQEDEHAISEFLGNVRRYWYPSGLASALAIAISDSGTCIPTKQFPRVSSVHSTGAPGSLSTLLAPIFVAACGIHVPLVSVRGSVAGAIDSLASIPGYNTSPTIDEFLSILDATRLAHIGHSGDIAPADRILWDLRARLNAKQIPLLIAASLLGKKIAAGAHCGCVDIRVGPAGNAGATLVEAFETAWMIVSAAKNLGMRVSCLFSDATRLAWPRIGRLDALLSILDILSEPKLVDHSHVQACREIAALACHAADPVTDLATWRTLVLASIQSGNAKATFEASIAAHRANHDALEFLCRQAESRQQVLVETSGEPTPVSVSTFFKAVRSHMNEEHSNMLGATWNAESKELVVHLPVDSGVDEAKLRVAATALRANPAATSEVVPSILLFNDAFIHC